MDSLEIDFARIVKEHKSTIYMVCYMFSKDEDEVQTFSRISLSTYGKAFRNSEVTAALRHGSTG